MYDPEAIYQDADIEMWEMQRAANANARLAQQDGKCPHYSSVGYVGKVFYPEQEGLKPGQVACTDGCGKVFDSDEAMYEDMLNQGFI